MHYPLLVELVEKKLINAIGVSVFNPSEELITMIKTIPNTVVHCILGVITIDKIKEMYDKGVRLLLLGFKATNRGEAFMEKCGFGIYYNINEVNNALPEIINHFKVVSFDNKALEQLNVRRLMGEDEYNMFYMGDDGVSGRMTSATMFIDMVDNTFSFNSMERLQFNCDGFESTDSMYQFLCKYKAV